MLHEIKDFSILNNKKERTFLFTVSIMIHGVGIPLLSRLEMYFFLIILLRLGFVTQVLR